MPPAPTQHSLLHVPPSAFLDPPLKMNIKIEQELNFVVDNDSQLFLDAQEAKKVSERTVVR